jgi:hypothetical protein
MTRTVPPPHHTRKLRELLVAHLLDLSIGRHVDARIIRPLRTYADGDDLPHGTVAAYLRLRGGAPTSIGGHNDLVALSAALRGTRCCPPGARYAPTGWAEYLKNEAAKVAKDAQ